MLETAYATRGMVTAPHHLAAGAGLSVLREGGNAIEAALAAQAVCSVVYPQAAGPGGDAFWLVHEPGKAPISIEGCGATGREARPQLYRDHGLREIPASGVLSACTVAGTVSAWQAATEIAARWGGVLPLSRLFEDAIHLARTGSIVTGHQAASLAGRARLLLDQPGFARHFLLDGHVPREGQRLAQPGLAELFERLAAAGLDDFYRGAVGHHLGAELQRLGCPLSSEDLARHRSVRRRPLMLTGEAGALYNLPPPTQGLAALMIVGLFERLAVADADGAEFLHGLIEATKTAFAVRDAHITDPSYMSIHATTYLTEALLDRLASAIYPRQASPWKSAGHGGEAAWIGVIDNEGRAVSAAISLGAGYGSGVAVGEFGVLWQGRGPVFGLEAGSSNHLAPGRKPAHSLCPAMARFKDGRVMVFGSSGGDAQPQSLAMIHARIARFGQGLQRAVSAPRWRLEPGRGGRAASVLLEEGFGSELVRALRGFGHRVTAGPAFDPNMGQAGALLRHEDGRLEGAADPRSDGAVAAW